MTAGLVALAVLATIVAVGIWAVPLLGPSAPAATVADRKPLTDRIPAPFVRPRLGNKGGMGCQYTLLRLVEDWRKTLESHEYVAAILMDLTKAFGCLPHNLLLFSRVLAFRENVVV
ncbi:hypothetical protein NP493_7g07014 [Ridgeia piscesae]|uniref:Reverse transcriptase domain-containing protein n=1 Tax=Ridgeia piscesae TaxID=27915 RepID=A0AAD9PF99_RIDPI|nr:hypothetical protein NP493_7g07014 [Ridgeia piscesae]